MICYLLLPHRSFFPTPHTLPCKSQCLLWIAPHGEREDPSSMPLGTEATPAPENGFLACNTWGGWGLQFLGSEKIKTLCSQIAQLVWRLNMLTPAGPAGLAGTGKRGFHSGPGCQSQPPSTAAETQQGLECSTAWFQSAPPSRHCHASEKHTQQSLMCRCQQPKGKGLDRQISA